jgi:hypothetical protein
MRVITTLSLLSLVLANLALEHTDHGHGGPADTEVMQDYARRHITFLRTAHILMLMIVELL